MGRRYFWRLVWPVPLVLLQRCLDLAAGADRRPPAELLINAVAGRITNDAATSIVLVSECIVFLLLFLVLYGDSVAEQQRTGAVYRFSRMPSRNTWFCRQTLALGGFAFGYCGIYVFLHGVISRYLGKGGGTFWPVVLSVWLVFSLIAWTFGMGCNGLCGRFGASVGVVVSAMALILLAAMSIWQVLPWWIQMVNPASFLEAVFTDWTVAARKAGVLCLELLGVTVPIGRYFCKKDLFVVEGDG